eukprot:2448580-Pyramimonas_sp.AAC.1
MPAISSQAHVVALSRDAWHGHRSQRIPVYLPRRLAQLSRASLRRRGEGCSRCKQHLQKSRLGLE